MDSDNLKLFNHTVSQLCKGKSVGHSTDSDIGYLEYKEMYTKELIKLNDDELIELNEQFFEHIQISKCFFATVS